MLTYNFAERGKRSLYEHLYHCIREDILSGRLRVGEKLPSKRMLAQHLGVSVITVENAYAQLILEGYLQPVEKRGYYVTPLRKPLPNREGERPPCRLNSGEEPPDCFADFRSNSVSYESFPFTLWAKTMRETLADHHQALLTAAPPQGVAALRQAIAGYLDRFRGMRVDPEQILIGAGTEYLYGLLIQIIGRGHVFATENPGYQKAAQILESQDIRCRHVDIDGQGMSCQGLRLSGADVAHLSPSHHFPTGIVMPIQRRLEILGWAKEAAGRYIIEDDYDCEFRLQGKPLPTLRSIDREEKVVYLNTFAKTLAPSFRISYMILPPHLAARFRERLGFYSCTVPNFEQYALARFMERGDFERHINRMRSFYKTNRDLLIKAIKESPLRQRASIREEHAGLHFLLHLDTGLSDGEIVANAAANGLKISCLSEYYAPGSGCSGHILLVNYSGLPRERIAEAAQRLAASIPC